MLGDAETTIATLREAARVMRSVATSTAEEVVAIEAAIRALDVARCERLAHMHESREHEAEGASSIATWARRELGQDAGLTRQQVRAASTCRDLPAVGEAAAAGRISFEHVVAFTFAVKHIGLEETRLLAEPLLQLAERVTPGELFARIRQARAVIHADDLDRAWLNGMDQRDIRLAKTTDGWHLTGFLDTATGAKLKTILDNLSVPRDGADDRRASERRMDALDDLCTSVLEHGLPTDNGVRPHLNVTVDAETLQAMATQDAHSAPGLDATPAILEGFGPIGPQLLAHLLCGAELTPFLTSTIDQNTNVLDVGRSQRLATPRQAKAIALRQHGACAAPGCTHPISHNHHLTWWSTGGRTDLDNLIGLCRKCHTLVHTGKLDLTRGSPHTLAA